MGIFDKLKRTKSEEEKQLKQAAVDSGTQKTKASNEPADKSKKADKKTEAKQAAPIGDAHGVLLYPMLTEKSFKLQQANKYSFFIAPTANKHEVKSAIKEVYGVAPLSVRVMRKRPVKKYRWGREVGQTKNAKKAIVTMPEGTVLNLTD